MKIVLAGAFGNLGTEILRKLIAEGHEVVAAARKDKAIPGLEGKYTFFPMDVQNPESLKGLCDGADAVITTVGLTKGSAAMTAYDVDYAGNLAILNEAKRAGVKKFNYISCIACDHKDARKVPMLDAKYKVEQELRRSGIDYVIYRPTGYFYDIIKVFRPYIEKGEMQLLKIRTLAEKIRGYSRFNTPDPKGWELWSTELTLMPYYKWFIKADRFTASDACVGCGKCVRSCPLNNISLAESKPVWGSSCTHCVACINLCPTGAIEYGRMSLGKPRYQCLKYKPEN